MASLCAGNKPNMIEYLYEKMFRWLATNPNGIEETCRYLNSLEVSRPIPNSPKLIEEINKLPQSEEEFKFDNDQFKFTSIWDKK